MPISPEAATWGLRLLVGLEPDNAAVELHRAGYETIDDMRTAFLQTPQGRELYRQANASSTTQGVPSRYAIPLFLLRAPDHADVPWTFQQPSMTAPVCQLCTFEQMEDPAYARLCQQLGLVTTTKQRKFWEFAYILSALQARGLLGAGRTGLGFGTGQEPLPSAFAAAGVRVTATDAPAELNYSENWARSLQWTERVEDLWHEKLVDHQAFTELVSYQPVDMNLIPSDLRDYDFCWSACCLEHLGGIRQGLDFIHNSLDTLLPGGTAVHTTEFNLGSNDTTVELEALCLFRKQDIELVIHELIAAGHRVETLNLWPGSTPTDEHVDLPPFSSPHLKLVLEGATSTSIGLIITKRTSQNLS